MTKAYRESLDKLSAGEKAFDRETFENLQQASPRKFGIGTYRFRQSRNSI